MTARAAVPPAARASLKYFGESRLELAPPLLDQIEVDGQELHLAQRRLAGRRRDVDARGVDAALRDHLLRRRRDHELREQLGGVGVERALDQSGRRRDSEHAFGRTGQGWVRY